MNEKIDQDMIFQYWNDFFNNKNDQISEQILKKNNHPYFPFFIDYNELMIENPQIVYVLHKNPEIGLHIGNILLDEKNNELNEEKGIRIRSYIRLFNLPDEFKISLADLNISHMGKIIQFNCQINVRSFPMHRIDQAAFICSNCSFITYIPSDRGFIPNPEYCNHCTVKGHNFLVMKDDEHILTDIMRLEVEDVHDLDLTITPEKIEVLLEGDLLNKIVRPEIGQRATITGIYKNKRYGKNNSIPSEQRGYVDAIHINIEEKQEMEITSIDIEMFESIKDNALDMIQKSIATTIHGYTNIKKSLVLGLFGGLSKENCDGTYQRGDIHIHLVGDPSCGKTQLMKSTLRYSPKSIFAGGKGTTGVGLVGTVKKDEFSKSDWVLRIGAMGKADRGHIGIDELDKMNDQDRDHLREGMESGCATLHKASVSAKIYTRCGVFATSNPSQEYFDENEFKTIIEQDKTSPAIKSRFDLTFHILREKDTEGITKICESMVKSRLNDKNHEPIWNDPIQIKKYIFYARSNYFPSWSEEIAHKAMNYGVNLISTFDRDVRLQNSIFRLSEASARGRLSDIVEDVDVDFAVELLQYSIKSSYEGITALQ